MTRFPFLIAHADEELVGTLHQDSRVPMSGVGVLLFNAGPAPRAGNSDLSVHLGDRLAGLGFPCVRLDLVGLGDSTGVTPPTIDLYWREVLAGRNEAPIAKAVRECRQRLGVESLMVGGLCAGAISAIQAAHAAPEGIGGLILLEPNFRTVPETGPNAGGEALDGAPPQAPRSKFARVTSAREWLYWMTGESRWARAFRPLRPGLERVLERRIGHTLPSDANVAVVMRWRHLCERGLPSLVVMADQHLSEKYGRRILGSLPGSCIRAIRAEFIPGTNHILTGGQAGRLVGEAVQSWMLEQGTVVPQVKPAGDSSSSL